MQIAEIDNKFRTLQCILWQYDNAVNLIKFIKEYTEGLFDKEVDELYTWFMDKVFGVFSKSDGKLEPNGGNDPDYRFGLDMWGKTLGFPRPQINETVAWNSWYKNVLQGLMFLYDSSADGASIAEYLDIAFKGTLVCVDQYVDGFGNIGAMALIYSNNFGIKPEGDVFTCVTKDNKEFYVRDNKLYEKKHGVLALSDVEYDVSKFTYVSTGDIKEKVVQTTWLTKDTSDEHVAYNTYLFLNPGNNGNQRNREILLPYPTGVRINEPASVTGVIGLNEDHTNGQKLENFAPQRADAMDETVNGGIFGA